MSISVVSRRLALSIGGSLLFLSTSLGVARAQSLDSHHPTVLKPGVNRGTVDSLVGPQYWTFTSVPGKAKIVVHFAAMGVLGAPVPSTIQIVLHDSTGWSATASLTSKGKVAELVWPGSFEARQNITLEVRPPVGTLVRSGGNYDIQVLGAVDYNSAQSPSASTDEIVGAYSLMTCYSDLECGAVRFLANGTVRTADGQTGTWKLFDPDTRLYVVKLASHRIDVKLIPGQGLVEPSDPTIIVFQAVRSSR